MRLDDARYTRLMEYVPGGLVWATLIAALVLSWAAPLAVILFIIVFDLYWAFRMCYFVFYLLVATRRYHATIKTDWEAKLLALSGHARLYHLIFLPTYKEDLEILRATFRSLVAAKYPSRHEKFIIV